MASENGTACSFESISDMAELTKLMQCLSLPLKGCHGAADMMDRVRQHVRSCSSRVKHNPHQAFSLISGAVKQDLHKRKKLLNFYTAAENSLAKMDGKSRELLRKSVGDVKTNLAAKRGRLNQRDYVVLVAGETSAGKSSFLNMILGEELLPSSLLSTTSTICELKYGRERRVQVHPRDGGPSGTEKSKTYRLRDDQPCMEQIAQYVKQERNGKSHPHKRVEIFLPHALLQDGIIIVDSPGIGESEVMDDIVTDYLPKAFAFIYIINSPNAGGVQKDRIEKLLNHVRTERAEFNPQCALFVCNKWDIVPFDEREQVISYITRKLRMCWPGLDIATQVTYLSTKNAVVAQKYDIITYDFANLLDSIGTLISASMETNLQLHWRWFDSLLGRMIYQTRAFIKASARDQVENRKRMKSILTRLEELEGHQKDVMRELQNHLDTRTQSAVTVLIQHLSCEDVKRKFCHWEEDDMPKEESWQSLQQAIEKRVKDRAREFIEDWEERQEAFATARESLVEHFGAKFNIFERKLLSLEQCVVASQYNDGDTSGQPEAQVLRHFIPNVPLTTRNKLIIGATLPIWLPFSLVAVIVGTPVIGAAAVAQKVQFRRFKSDPCLFLQRRSRRYIENLATEKAIRPFVEVQLEDAHLCLKQIQARIPELIEADRALCKQLLDEARSRKKAEEFYRPLNDDCQDIRGQLALFAIREILPLDENVSGLEWLEHPKYLLGQGKFAKVYKGRLGRKSWRPLQYVALKVYRDPLMSSNACAFLAEERNLRRLSHPHIMSLYGTVLHQRKGTSEEHPILVLELCDMSLSSYILRQPENAPATSSNLRTKRLILRWAVQIVDGLRFIHKEGLVHRDLKLENILIKDKCVKIADVGLAKSNELISGTLCGTPLYIAPEVTSGRIYGRAADMYSFGLVLWEMWYGQRVFEELRRPSLEEFFEKIRSGYRPLHVQGKSLPPDAWRRVMETCWHGNPESRLTAEECVGCFTSLREEKTAGHHKRL